MTVKMQGFDVAVGVPVVELVGTVEGVSERPATVYNGQPRSGYLEIALYQRTGTWVLRAPLGTPALNEGDTYVCLCSCANDGYGKAKQPVFNLINARPYVRPVSAPTSVIK